MAKRPPKIALVEPDPQLVELLVDSLARRFKANLTCVTGAESCLDVDMLNPQDLVIAELALDGSDGLELAGHLMSLGARPIILLADQVTCEQAIDAMRLGVSDLFRKPFPVGEMLDSAERLVRRHRLRRERATRHRRLRTLVRRIIHEHRSLRQRTDLICRDLVGAHRRLVDRVLSVEALKG